jgi:hypothetical protein
MKRVLVFNFFAGVMERGIPLYAQNLAECMRRVGLVPVELRCPAWLRRWPRPAAWLLAGGVPVQLGEHPR